MSCQVIPDNGLVAPGQQRWRGLTLSEADLSRDLTVEISVLEQAQMTGELDSTAEDGEFR